MFYYKSVQNISFANFLICNFNFGCDILINQHNRILKRPSLVTRFWKPVLRLQTSQSRSGQSSVDREEVCIESTYFCDVAQIARDTPTMLCSCCVAIIAILYILFDVNYFLRIIFTILWGRLFEKKKKLFDTTTIYGKFSY